MVALDERGRHVERVEQRLQFRQLGPLGLADCVDEVAEHHEPVGVGVCDQSEQAVAAARRLPGEFDALAPESLLDTCVVVGDDEQPLVGLGNRGGRVHHRLEHQIGFTEPSSGS